LKKLAQKLNSKVQRYGLNQILLLHVFKVPPHTEDGVALVLVQQQRKCD